jgi:hypothetical protein
MANAPRRSSSVTYSQRSKEAHRPRSERAFGRRNPFGLARIDRNRRPERPRDALEAGFGDVMAVGAVQGLYMQSEPSVCGQRLKEFAHQLGVERADFLGRERDVEDEEGSTGQIERDAGQRWA